MTLAFGATQTFYASDPKRELAFNAYWAFMDSVWIALFGMLSIAAHKSIIKNALGGELQLRLMQHAGESVSLAGLLGWKISKKFENPSPQSNLAATAFSSLLHRPFTCSLRSD